MIMGTASYMSPEQAAGKPVDRRADIWSFGVVLWEILCGRKLFDGETVSHTLADVLRAQIDLTQLPPNTPAPIVALLKRCLDRDLRTRLQAIGEARIAIQSYLADPGGGAASPVPVPAPPARRAWAPWIVAAVFAVAAAGSGYLAYWHTQEAKPKVVKTFILPPEKTRFAATGLPALSPDGRRLAFVATQVGKSQLWIRDLDSLAARAITDTLGAANPFWSPNSQSVGFFADGKIKRIDIAGGPVLTVASTDGTVHAATWSTRDVILFPTSATSGLYRVAASGGPPVAVTTLDAAAGEVSHRLPWFFPDGRHFLFTNRNQDLSGKSAVYVGDLDSKERTLVLKAEGQAEFVPAGSFLVFTAAGLTDAPLMAQAFDLSTFRTAGDPFPIAESVDQSAGVWAQHQFSVSRDGVLAYLSGGLSNPLQLTWVDRSGTTVGTIGAPNNGQRSWSISPDGGTVAVEVEKTGGSDIWLHDLAHESESRFSFNPANSRSSSPSWSPDGKSLMFSYREGSQPATLVRKPIGGGVQEPVGSPWGNPPRSTAIPCWSRDGRYIVAELQAGGLTERDIWILPLTPAGEKPRPYLAGRNNERSPSLSPSGDWLAYASDETRRYEVYLQSFPNPGRQFQVSVNGGFSPVWSRDGTELYFISPDRRLMAVSIRNHPGALEIGAPKALFDSRTANTNAFDVDKNGRFLLGVQQGDSAIPLTLVVNWPAGLKR
jgi:Tol biopolymer transport system component